MDTTALEKLMAENRDVLVRMKNGDMKEIEMELKECYSCGAKPVMEKADGRVYIYCPVCGASHFNCGDKEDMNDIVSRWNEAMYWLEMYGLPTCSGCRPIGGPCKECDIPL